MKKNIGHHFKFNRRKAIYFLVCLLLLAIIGIHRFYTAYQLSVIQNKTIPAIVKKAVNDDKRLFKITNIKEVNGVYAFDISFPQQGNQKYTSYISKNGKMIFYSGADVADLGKFKPQAAVTNAPTKTYTCDDIPKTDKPKLTAYIVSNCPYGLQMQRVTDKAINESSALNGYINIKYIGSINNDGKITSMHGDAEAQENLRQICIREEQTAKYWPYVSCYMKAGESDKCLAVAGVDSTAVQSCTNDKKRGLAFAQKDFDLATKLQISGSPTLLLDDKTVVPEFSFGGRNPYGLQQIICCASKNKPAFCSTPLSKDEVQPSFSDKTN